MSGKAIEIQNLEIAIDGKDILQGLNLEVQQGEILAIVGGSGSGKSTLLNAILMLLPAKSGSIKVFKEELIGCNPAIAEKIRRQWGVLFQSSALFSSLTVLENIMFPLREHTNLNEKTLHEIAQVKIAITGLPAEAGVKYPSELSGGMLKRAALARALALDPMLLFLDEPTAGLDPVSAAALDKLILELKKSLGLTVVLVTHDLDTLWSITDRVAFLGSGKVLQSDPMQKLVKSAIPEIKDYFSGPRARAAQRQYHVDNAEQDRNQEK